MWRIMWSMTNALMVLKLFARLDTRFPRKELYKSKSPKITILQNITRGCTVNVVGKESYFMHIWDDHHWVKGVSNNVMPKAATMSSKIHPHLPHHCPQTTLPLKYSCTITINTSPLHLPNFNPPTSHLLGSCSLPMVFKIAPFGDCLQCSRSFCNAAFVSTSPTLLYSFGGREE